MIYAEVSLLVSTLILLFIIARIDAHTLTISYLATGLLFLNALLWTHVSLTSVTIPLAMIGGALGATIVVLYIGIAVYRKKKWPVMPGDLFLFGSCATLLGPMGFAICLIINFPLNLTYRLCLSKKRGRAFMRGYAPAAPSLCTSVAIVFLYDYVKGTF